MKSLMLRVASLCSLLCSLSSLTLGQNVTQTRSFTTLDGTYYVYDYVPAQQNKSTLLFLHGFPSTRHDWAAQIANLTVAGYGIVAPDLLGFGDSDRPTDVEAYRFRRISGHLTEILDDCGIETVVGVAHDWGVPVLSRALFWYPERFVKAAFLSVGYVRAGALFDIDAYNVESLEKYNYTQWGYWYFFNSYDAAQISQDNVSLLLVSSMLQILTTDHASGRFFSVTPVPEQCICMGIRLRRDRRSKDLADRERDYSTSGLHRWSFCNTMVREVFPPKRHRSRYELL